MICALDTMTLVWGLRDHGRSAEPEKEKRASILLQKLEDEEATVILPAISLAELITPLNPRQQSDFLGAINDRFRIAPFDVHAAAIAAQLWQAHRQFKQDDKTKTRAILKADTLIIASAKVAGASVFYSHDAQCRKLAAVVMHAYDLPTHDEQLFPRK